MIYQAMELIRRNLNTFLSNNAVVVPEPVALKNVAYATPDTPGGATDESAQIYMSLVNVEEEQTLKNLSAVRQSDIRPLAYVNPPMYINLYLLFSANHKDYDTAIITIGKVLMFFQGNKTFSLGLTPVPSIVPFAAPGENDYRIKVTLDLVSLTFEQVNYLWGSLGGKQMPFLLFKARMVEIDADRMLKGGTVVSELQIN